MMTAKEQNKLDIMLNIVISTARNSDKSYWGRRVAKNNLKKRKRAVIAYVNELLAVKKDDN